MIEEESQQIKSQLEQQLIEAILDSFLNHMNQNAIFLAERLVYEHDTEEYRSLLAECYLRYPCFKGLYIRVQSELNEKYKYSYQLAVAYFRSKKYKKAELVLLVHFKNCNQFVLQSSYIPNGGFGHFCQDRFMNKYIEQMMLRFIIIKFWIKTQHFFGQILRDCLKQENQSISIKFLSIKSKNNMKKPNNKVVTFIQLFPTYQRTNQTFQNQVQKKSMIVKKNLHSLIMSKTIFSNWSLSLNNTYLQFIKQLNENFLTLIKENWSQNDSNPGKGLQNQQSLLSQPFQLSQNLNKNFNNFNPKKVITKKFIIQLFNHHLVQQNAIPNFQKLSPQHYRLGWVLEKVSRSFMDQVKYADAERVWKEMRLIEPIRLERLHYYSSCLWHLKKQSELTYLAHSCLQISIQSPDTWIAIGNCFSFIKEIDNSIKFFGRAIQLRKDYSYAYILSGHEFSSNENCQQAKKLYGALPHLIKDNTMVGGGRVIYSLLFL